MTVRDAGLRRVRTPRHRGHHSPLSARRVDTAAPARFVPAAARAVERPVSALQNAILLDSGGRLMWMATFAGYKGDVRGDAHGNVVSVVPYP